MTKLHIDTDLGGDVDDLCALALALKWDGTDITGITTVTEENGKRAGYTRHALKLAGRSGIPVAAGADVSGGFYRYRPDYIDEMENWLEAVPPSPNRLDDALELLKSSIEQGAILVGLGPYTNFALLDQKYPGILQQAQIYLMGGWIYPPKKGYPQWESPRDYNIQQDVISAKYVLEHAHPTLIPITITVETAIRRAYLPRLQQAGPLNALIAHQAEVYTEYRKREGETDETYETLPADLLNFQHDPLACAVALGWSGVKKALVPLTFEVQDGWLYERVNANGRPTTVVVEVDGPAFNTFWLETVTR